MEGELTPAEREKVMRAVLFVPCETKDALQDWVRTFLEIDLPNCTVCLDDVDNPPSNSNPMDLLWEIYQAARHGRDKTRTQYLFYASRDSWKSMVASIIEILCLFHLDRDCAHLAAILSQAKNVQRYLKAYLKLPVLRDFLTSKNEMTIEVSRFEKDGKIISPVEWKELDPEERSAWKLKERFVQIIVATLSGTNSLHCSMVIMDELDLAPAEPVEEAMMIASPGKERRELPMVLMTSSRKFGYGLVQQAIDNAEERGINLRHWNLIDSAEACPPERHLPPILLSPLYVSEKTRQVMNQREYEELEPEKQESFKPRAEGWDKIPIYYNEKNLRSVDEKNYLSMTTKQQSEFKKAEGYAGCLQNCRLFAQCRGRLATEQHSQSPLLKPLDSVEQVFRRVGNVEKAKAQLMCWKPSNEGMIYPALQPEIHVITAAAAAEIITGEHYETMTKNEFVMLLREHDALFGGALDWGHVHPFAGVLAGILGHRGFIFDAWEIPDLDSSQWIEVCTDRLLPYNPDIYADTAYPATIKDFRKRGFRMKKWKKYAGSVLDGIEAVRGVLRPPSGPPQLYFIKGDDIDPGVDLAFKRMASYHWKTDSAGRITMIPNDTEDDVCDAIRYLVLNIFGKVISGISIGSSEPVVAPNPLFAPAAGQKVYHPTLWAQQLIAEHLGEEVDDVVMLNPKIAPPEVHQLGPQRAPGPNAPSARPGHQLRVVPRLAQQMQQQAEEEVSNKGSSGSFVWDL